MAGDCAAAGSLQAVACIGRGHSLLTLSASKSGMMMDETVVKEGGWMALTEEGTLSPPVEEMAEVVE
jgi:hypothetical protein